MKIEARQIRGWISGGDSRVVIEFEADDYEKHSTFSFDIHTHALRETYMATRLTLYITHEDAERLLQALADAKRLGEEDANATV